MSDTFEQLDEWMMSATRAPRERKISAQDLDRFEATVMRKIQTRANGGVTFPAIGVALVVTLSLALLIGIATLVITWPKPENASRVVPISESPAVFHQGATAAPSLRPIEESTLLPVIPERIADSPSPGTVGFNAENVLKEIEALRELGVWTDEDEEATGIPVEVLMADLESFMPESPKASGMAAAG